VKRAVDGDDVALGEHLFQGVNTAAANLFLHLWLERLIVEVEELFAVEWLEAAQHPLANASDGDGANDFALKVILVLGHRRDIPLAPLNLLVRRNKVPHQEQNSHDDVLGDRHDVGAGDFCHCDTTICLVCRIKIDMVGSNAGSDCKLELLGLCEAFGGKVTGVEAGDDRSELATT
jgi:hypothetical protein